MNTAKLLEWINAWVRQTTVEKNRAASFPGGSSQFLLGYLDGKDRVLRDLRELINNGAFDEENATADDLRMTGTTVVWHEDDWDPDSETGDPAGWVAHAVLSDDTLSWPMGTRTFPTKEEAEAEATRIVWTDTGPVIGPS